MYVTQCSSDWCIRPICVCEYFEGHAKSVLILYCTYSGALTIVLADIVYISKGLSDVYVQFSIRNMY